jgi:hypothetical protein
LTTASITRRGFLGWLLPACGFALATEGDGLDVRLEGGRIRVTAPQLRFLTGKPLERLHNGAPAPFAIQLSASTDRWATVVERDIQRFVLSYDLWEERFAAVKAGSPRKSASHLPERAAEAWCIGEVSLARAGIGENQPFWVRLDVHSENPAEQAELDRQDAMSLTRLIELFSRRTRGEQTRWSVEAGPVQIAELRRAPERRNAR